MNLGAVRAKARVNLRNRIRQRINLETAEEDWGKAAVAVIGTGGHKVDLTYIFPAFLKESSSNSFYSFYCLIKVISNFSTI